MKTEIEKNVVRANPFLKRSVPSSSLKIFMQ